MSKSYRRWLRICTDCAYIGATVLAVWATPLLHQVGPLALLPYAGLAGMIWSAVTAAGLILLWFRHEWPASRARQRLLARLRLWPAALDPRRLAWTEREA
ncbi:hypothetical protein J2Z79_001547 [Symbiobacterium terraclitae]|uniref:Uncharacterized protein n=1 Tax=Symbiobacterium terraclitae TaxID=557451 RepID=A0ABS4JRI2_9FIRM|nr:hypothetical protein [Symbiobacterium terraclitae]MBP2018148.1 hypothetical protein [Symbiobacterium terraclitae]